MENNNMKLAVLSNEKKIRVYSPEERLMLAKNITETLLRILGVSSKADEMHHVEVIRYISENRDYSPNEFLKAFNLVLDGKIEIELYQSLNCVILAKVMKAYGDWKLNEVRKIKAKNIVPEIGPTITEKEKQKLIYDAVLDECQSYEKTEEINRNRNYLYEVLIELGFTNENLYKQVSWKFAIKETENEQKKLRRQDRLNHQEFRAESIIKYKCKLIADIFRRNSLEKIKNKLDKKYLNLQNK